MEGNADSERDGGKDRLVPRRRLVSFVAGFVVYVAVVAAVASNPTETTYTTHTVRYLVLVALFYAFLSSANVAHGYFTDGGLHEDAPDFAGGVSVVVGLGVFYAGVLEKGGNTAADAVTIAVLAFVTVATVAGMLLILKF